MRFTQGEAEAVVGARVKSLVGFAGVRRGTHARIIRADRVTRDAERGYDVVVQWDLPGAVPLADWFTRDEFERYLERVPEEHPQ